MHEAGLAQRMLDIAAKAAGENAGRVKSVVVCVGELGGVMPDALMFAFDAMKKGYGLARAQMKLERLPVRAKCRDCGEEYAPEGFPFVCPECESRSFRIIQGEEIFVKELEIYDEN